MASIREQRFTLCSDRIVVFVVVALAVFVVASLLDERSSKARLLRERLSTVQKTGEARSRARNWPCCATKC